MSWSKPHPRILTTARANGTAPPAAVTKDLLVGANCALSRSDLDQQLARLARSRIVRAVLCAHGAYFLAPFAAPQPDPRSRLACSPAERSAKKNLTRHA